MKNKLIVITGPTASGKTRIASEIASKLDGEIISADSRQVYKDMNLGTGKDYDDYIVFNKKIPYHLIDILEAGDEYNVFEFQNDFYKAFNDIINRNKVPILCGGTGMYIESVLKKYNFINVPLDTKFRETIKNKSNDELIELLTALKKVHNTTDLIDRERLIRALEIEYFSLNTKNKTQTPDIDYKIFAIKYERNILRERITERLKKRLENGMINEVENLINKGIDVNKLKYYGLEYKYIAMYLNNEIGFDEMFRLLNTAIHQFSKRQMTWLRKMERTGFEINWIDGELSNDEKLKKIIENL